MSQVVENLEDVISEEHNIKMLSVKLTYQKVIEILQDKTHDQIQEQFAKLEGLLKAEDKANKQLIIELALKMIK